MAANTLREIYSISVQWILRDPFWGHLLSGIPKRIVAEGPSLTWGVEGEQIPVLQLYIHPKEWNRIPSTTQKRQRLQHELLHLVFNHPFEADHYAFPHLYDLACDWVVQTFEDSPAYTQSFPQPASFDFGPMNKAMNAKAYYTKLESFWLRQLRSSTPDPMLDRLNHYKKSPARSAHHHWHTQMANRTKAEKEIIKASIDQLILSTLDRVGPTALAHWPEALLLRLQQRQPHARPKLDWRRILRLFAGRHRKTQLKHTLRRPSKRYGTNPGIRIQQKQRILVVIDTSASIPESKFYTFFSEVHHLWKQGAAVHIVECDTEIRSDYPYQGQRPAHVSGRGGSSFDPPIKWANETHHPDAILYFTDGDAPRLTTQSRYPLLWVLSQATTSPWQQDQGWRIYLLS